MADTVPYKPAPGTIPTTPGVYRFRDEHDRVLYVGKAKNLRQRLANYFQPLHSLHERTRRMVLTAARVEWTIVATEFEALHLEFTWIKEYEPPFNVVFRDDKSYPYMVITLGDESPRVMVTRNRGIHGARYFGPYPKVWAVRETIDLMIRAFPIRTCSDASYRKAMESGRPCFAGQIGRCGGPCSQRVTIDEHRRMVDAFIDAMSGQDGRLERELEQAMQSASANLEFERAAILRDRLHAFRTVLAKSSVVLADHVDVDVFASVQDELSAAVHLFAVRGGRVRGTRSWVVDTELDVSRAELSAQMLRAAYQGAEVPPRTVAVTVLPESVDEIETWLTERRAAAGLGGRVQVHVPKRGDRRRLQENALANAAHALQVARTKRTSDYGARSQALTDLQEALGMHEAPLRIECFDVSHLGGTDVVASMVVFEDGLPRKDQYRRFSIEQTTDDTDSIRQVIGRRARYLIDGGDVDEAEGECRSRFAYPPQLLLVDGGRPQVEAARQALETAGVHGVALAGIAKRLEELWLPESEYPVILPRSSEALYLVQRLRDEAHRFAITYQRKKRSSAIESELSAIAGLGGERVRRLLRHFGSAKRVRAASVDDLVEVRGIGATLAEQIHGALHTDRTDTMEVENPRGGP